MNTLEIKVMLYLVAVFTGSLLGATIGFLFVTVMAFVTATFIFTVLYMTRKPKEKGADGQ